MAPELERAEDAITEARREVRGAGSSSALPSPLVATDAQHLSAFLLVSGGGGSIHTSYNGTHAAQPSAACVVSTPASPALCHVLPARRKHRWAS